MGELTKIPANAKDAEPQCAKTFGLLLGYCAPVGESLFRVLSVRLPSSAWLEV